MDTESDLTTADRDFLIAIIAQLQATVLEQQRVIERLERRIAELEGRAKPDGPPRMPGHKAKSARKPPAQQGPRTQRRHGFARPRMTPTHRVEHVVESCPDCGAHLSGGWTQRTREVIELPVVPVQVTEHVFIARTCPVCRRRRVPTAQLDGVALGRQRLGVNLLSRIATLREEGRLPIRSIQWYLRTVHQLRLSVGAIVSAIHQTAQQAQPAVAGMVDRIRASPVVHADETGWRQNGNNGYVCEPLTNHFQHSHRALLPAAGSGQGGGGRSAGRVILRSTGQRLLRRLSPLRWPQAAVLGAPAAGHPRPANPLPQSCALARWAAAVQRLYEEAKAFSHPQAQRRRVAQLAWERKLLAICRPFLSDPSAVQGKLCRRIERFIKELFVFVAEPDVPADNNPAERSLRHLVISRKVSGGTRSERGTESKMTLASVFGTWRARGLNPLAACRQLLTSPLL